MTDNMRFWTKVQSAGPFDCWLWTAYLTPMGYGQVRWGGRTRLSHRVAYELMVGPIPAGLTLDHLCRTPACVNPYHLDPVTRRVNTERGVCAELKRTATHCKRDHEFTPENTIIASGRGHRACRTCTKARQMQWYLDRKAALPASNAIGDSA